MIQQLLGVWVACCVFLPFILGFLPHYCTNLSARSSRQLAISAALMTLIAACCGMVGVYFLGVISHAFATLQIGAHFYVSLGIYYDRLAAVMLLLVSLIGFVVLRFSERYLDGDPSQARFFKWLSFTITMVMVLVTARNLILFFTAWVLSSLGLHNLLTFYKDRPGALLVARKKFLISRFGDVMLFSALLLTYYLIGSFEYEDIFSIVQHDGWNAPMHFKWIALGLVLAALTKSAQFPFHSWLPDTMEAPTPVSALMHAGIINAGGFMIVRMSPLIDTGSMALDALAIVGTLTALFGAIVMLTKTDIKRSLAYSTIAQMGFMLLQCGLGEFSAAILHILSHACYKSHAFLTSGSVVDVHNIARKKESNISPNFLSLSSAVIAAIMIYYGIGYLLHMFELSTTKSPTLSCVLILSLAYLILNIAAVQANHAKTFLYACIVAVGVRTAYGIAYGIVDAWLQPMGWSDVQMLGMQSPLYHFIASSTAVLFFLLFAFQIELASIKQTKIGKILYVHAYNGFYLGFISNRITHWVWGDTSLVKGQDHA